MSVPVPPYLQNRLKEADQLPQLLEDVPEDVVIRVQNTIRYLVMLCATRDAQIQKLEADRDRGAA